MKTPLITIKNNHQAVSASQNYRPGNPPCCVAQRGMDGSNPEALEANFWGPSSQTIPETEMGYMVMGYRTFDTWLCITWLCNVMYHKSKYHWVSSWSFNFVDTNHLLPHVIWDTWSNSLQGPWETDWANVGISKPCSYGHLLVISTYNPIYRMYNPIYNQL